MIAGHGAFGLEDAIHKLTRVFPDTEGVHFKGNEEDKGMLIVWDCVLTGKRKTANVTAKRVANDASCSADSVK